MQGADESGAGIRVSGRTTLRGPSHLQLRTGFPLGRPQRKDMQGGRFVVRTATGLQTERWVLRTHLVAGTAPLFVLITNFTHLLMRLFHFATCFEQPSAHHQENHLYQYIIWYISHCVDDCLVCRFRSGGTGIPGSHLHRVIYRVRPKSVITRVRHKSVKTPLSHERLVVRTWLAVYSGWG